MNDKYPYMTNVPVGWERKFVFPMAMFIYVYICIPIYVLHRGRERERDREREISHGAIGKRKYPTNVTSILHMHTKSDTCAMQRFPLWIKWDVSFAKEPYKRDDILQKKPRIMCVLRTCARCNVFLYGSSMTQRCILVLYARCKSRGRGSPLWSQGRASPLGFATRWLLFGTMLQSCPLWLIYSKTLQSSPLGWLLLVGSIKLQVSCAEYSLFYRAVLQKRLII